jgi:hypothetical protein
MIMKCSECKHWQRLKISDQFLAEDEVGKCDGLLFDGIEIELKTGCDGGYIDVIETKHDFFCANHKDK